MTPGSLAASGAWPAFPPPGPNGTAATGSSRDQAGGAGVLAVHEGRAVPAAGGTPLVLVLDSNLLTAEAISLALSQLRYMARFVVPVTSTHVRDVASQRPGLALLDIDSVEPATCIDCVGVLRDEGVPVAVMGGRSDAYLLGECVDAGAACVVDKASPVTTLSRDIDRLLAGEVVLGQDRRVALTGAYRREARARRDRLAPFDVLTRREQQVLAELMSGHGADAIARRASVSTSTVRSQIRAILQKLGVSSQLAAAAMASQAGWSLDPGRRAG